METNGPGQYAPEDFVRLVGRTEKEPSLEAPHRHKEDFHRVQHSNWSWHRSTPPLREGLSAGVGPTRGRMRNEVFGTAVTRVTVRPCSLRTQAPIPARLRSGPQAAEFRPRTRPSAPAQRGREAPGSRCL